MHGEGLLVDAGHLRVVALLPVEDPLELAQVGHQPGIVGGLGQTRGLVEERLGVPPVVCLPQP